MKRILHSLLSFFVIMAMFTARVSAKEVTITFVLGKGTLDGRTGTFTETVSTEASVASSMYGIGGVVDVYLDDELYGFAGWSLSPSGAVVYSPEEFWDLYPSHDMTVYAVYDEKYQMTFDFGVGKWFDQTGYCPNVVRGRTYDFSMVHPEPLEPGYAFAGWSYDGVNPEVSTFELKNMSFHSEMALIAVYKEAVDVTFWSNEGYFFDGNEKTISKTVKAPKGYPIQLDVMVYDDYPQAVHTGWNINGDIVDDFDLQYTVFTEPANVFAVFEDANPITKINVQDTFEMKLGESIGHLAEVLPEDNNGYLFYATSRDAAIVKVSSHYAYVELTAVGLGTCQVRLAVIGRDGSYVDKLITVHVTGGDDPAACKVFGFCDYEGKQYWFEDGRRQAMPGDPKNIWDTVYGYERGREIYDPVSDAWYWLDCIYNGAKAADKEVWMPYIFQEDLAKGINKQGKWVRYNSNGAMIKGWYTVQGTDLSLYPGQAGNTYYYDWMTGEMVKGYKEIDGKVRHFDELSGVLLN